MFMGSAGGEGVVHNNITKKNTFMKMVELQPGFGFPDAAIESLPSHLSLVPPFFTLS